MMKNIIKVFLITVIISGLTWSVNAQEKPVVIGVPIPLSGDFKNFGMIMKNSFEMAMQDINNAGGINNRPISLLFSDDNNISSISEIFDKSGNKPVMLTGGYSSDITYKIAKAAEKKDLPFIICTASADRITQKGWKNIYRINPAISEYTKGLEDFWLNVVKPKSMAVIYENSMFGTGGALRIMEFCRDNAIEMQAYIGYDTKMLKPAYLRSLLAPVAADQPDIVYMISYLDDGVALVKMLSELKIKSLICGGGGGFTMEEFTQRAGKAAENMITASLWSAHVNYPGAETYYRQYKEKYNKAPDYHGAEAYASLIVAADALKRAASFASDDIREALNHTYVKTLFGPVRFYTYDDFERQNTISTLVLQIINNKFETIWPQNLASARFVFSGKK